MMKHTKAHILVITDTVVMQAIEQHSTAHSKLTEPAKVTHR